MNARQDGRQGHWYDPTALAEPENFPEPKPTSVKNSTGATVSSTRTDKPRHPRTYEAPLRTWTDVLAFLIFATLIVASAVITLYTLIAVLFILGQAVT